MKGTFRMTESVEEAKARVERELRERLERVAPPAASSASTEAPRPSTPVATIGLRCVECNAICDSDARFCTNCGVRFNARIVVRELVGGTVAERAR